MPRDRQRIHPRFTHIARDEAGVVLLGPDDWASVGGAAAELLPLLDAKRALDAAVAAMPEGLDPAEVYYAALLLKERGYVVDEGSPEAERSVGASTVPHTRSSPEHDAEVTRAIWRSWSSGSGWGTPVRLEPEQFDLPSSVCDVLVTASYLHPRVLDHADAHESLLLAKLAPESTWVGPRVGAGRPCAHCLTDRLALNHLHEALLHSPAAVETRKNGSPPAWLIESVRRLRRELSRRRADPPSLDFRITVVPAEGERTAHEIPGHPLCATCGRADGEPHRWRLESRPKLSDSRSGFRSVPLAETYRRYRHLVDPIAGLVRRLDPVPTDAGPLCHNYTASHPTAWTPPTLERLRDEARDQSGGKGSSDMEARVSALCEALERTSAVFRGHEPCRMTTLQELGDRGLHPNRCMLFSRQQYESRDLWNAGHANPFHWVPEPFDQRKECRWTSLRSLTSGEERHLPTAYIYFGVDDGAGRSCAPDTNGLAAGNNFEEALLQGFLELVERDAVALWWYNRSGQPSVDLDGARDDYVERLCEHYHDLGRPLWVLDLTSDLGIPVFAAISAQTGAEREDIIMGFGAHLDPRIALRRALTELNQALPHVLANAESRQELLPDFADAVTWWETATLEEHAYLRPHGGELGLDRFSYTPSRDLRDDIHYCMHVANRRDLEIIVADLTRRDIGLSVVRVVVPGLRHFWNRFAPGRLFDVPVSLGRRARPLAEGNLNPIPLFL